jgi:hypothetical protein
MLSQAEIKEFVVPLLVLSQEIDKHCWLKPTAIMLPVSLAGNGSGMCMGLPVIAGDRAALIYEPPKARED